MGFKEIRNDWSEYRLADGTVVKIRQIVTAIRRNGEQPNGEPRYDVDFQMICASEPPHSYGYQAQLDARSNAANAMAVAMEMPLMPIKKGDLQ